MAYNSDQFILEISAQLKNDSKELTSQLSKAVKEVEKSTKINLNLNDDKINNYIQKLKKSMNEINATMNSTNLDAQATSFIKFVDVLKEGAKYSKTIADSLERASGIKINLDNLRKQVEQNNSSTLSNNNTDKAIKNKALIESAVKQANYQVDQIQKKINGIKYTNISKNFEKELKSLTKMVNTPIDKLVQNLNDNKGVNSILSQINTMSKNISSNFKDIQSLNNSKITSMLNNKNYYVDERLNKYSNALNTNDTLYTSNDDYRNKIDTYISKLNEYQIKLNDLKKSNNLNFDTSSFDKMEYELNEMLALLNHKDFKNPVKVLADNTSIEDAKKQLQELAKAQSGLKDFSIREQANGIVKLTANYSKGANEVQKIVYSYNDATKAITKLDSATVKLNTSSKNTNATMSNSTSTISRLISTYFGLTSVIFKLRQSFSIVREMDSALTEMRKVSDETLSSLERYSLTTFDVGNAIGTTGLNIQQSTADWMRLGKSIEEASRLAKDTSILLNVSEFDNMDSATESMVSMTQAYQELSSRDIVDKLNLTGNNYSIATDDLATSLQKSSAALKTAKNDFDEAIALTVAGNSVVQNPDSVAAGIRTIALRMSGTNVAKNELEELGEETEGFLTSSKLNGTLEKLTDIDERGGISLLDTNGNYRSTAKVLMDLADRWEDIGKKDLEDGENRQNALLEALAGKNRSNILASILNDKDLLKTVYEDVSTNYKGSALEENEKYMDSLNGRIIELQNNWEKFSKYFFDSDLVKGTVSGISSLVGVFGDLVSVIGGIPTAVGALTLVGGLKNKGLFKLIDDENAKYGKRIQSSAFGMEGVVSGTFNNLRNKNISFFSSDFSKELDNDILCLNNYMAAVKGGQNATDAMNQHMATASASARTYSETMDLTDDAVINFASSQQAAQTSFVIQSKSITDMGRVIKEYRTGLTNCGMEQGQFLSAVRESNPQLANYLSTVKQGKASMTGYIASLAKAKLATIGLQAASIALNMVLTMGISYALSAIVSKISEVANKEKLLREEVDELVSSFEDQSSSLNQSRNTFDSLASSYETLAKGVNSLGENISLTSSEYEEYKSVVSQIADLVPNLVTGYNDQGVAILSCKGNVEELTKAYNEMFIASNNALLSDGGKVFKSFKNKADELINGKKAPWYSFVNRESDSLRVEDMRLLEKVSTNKDIEKAYEKYIENAKDSYTSYRIYDKLKESVDPKKGELIPDFIKRVIKQSPNIVSAAIKNYNKELEGEIKGAKSLSEGYLNNSLLQNKFPNMSKNMQNLAKQVVSSYDWDYYNSKNSVSELYKDIDTLLESLDNLDSSDEKKIKAVFDLQTKYNNGKITLEEYNKNVKGLDDILKTLDKDTQKRLKILLDVESDTTAVDDIKKKYNTINDLSTKKSNIDIYKSALTESNSGTGLSSETMESLEGMYSTLEKYDSSKLFEKTANGIQLNREELKKLQNEYLKQDLKQNYSELQKMIDEYDSLGLAINTCTDEKIKEGLIDQQNKLKSEIDEVAKLTNQYEALTSAYNQWIIAQETDNEGKKYDSYTEYLSTLKELNKAGLVGTDDYQSAVQLMSYDDLSGKDAGEYQKVYNAKISTMKKYFSGNKNGIISFFEDVQKLNPKWAKTTKDGTWEIDLGVNGADKVAKSLGISADAVQMLLQKSGEFGASVNLSYYESSLEAIATNAKLANDELIDMKKTSHHFNFYAKTIEDVNKEILTANKLLDKFKDKNGKLKNKEGSNEAAQVYTALIKKRQQLIEEQAPLLQMDIEMLDAETSGEKLISNINSMFDSMGTYDIQVEVSPDSTGKIKKSLNKLISDIESSDLKLLNLDNKEFKGALKNIKKSISENTKFDDKDLNTIATQLSSIDAEVLAKAKIDDEFVTEFTNKTYYAPMVVQPDTTEVDNFEKEDHHVDSWVEYGKVLTSELDKFMDSHPIVKATVEFTASGLSNIANKLSNVLNDAKKVGEKVATKGAKTGASILSNVGNWINKNILHEADGSASYVTGSAFAKGKRSGDWGIKSSGTALVGELGEELLVRDGKFQTIGTNSAELINYKPNDIIFNAKQTEQLFKYGKIVNGVSRGRALNSGSAFYNGTTGLAFDGSSGMTTTKNSYKYSSSSKKSSNKSSSDSSKDTKSLIDNLFDWIEIRLERLANKTQKWITLAENAISKSVQQSHYTSAINNTATQLSQNQTAKDKYLVQANALIKKSGIKNASAYAKKVRDGSLSIQSISNEKIKDFVTSYKEMYDKAVECSNAVMSLTGELQDLAETLYNLPTEHAAKKVEKYSDKMDVLSAKYENYRSHTTQNPNLDEQTKLQKSIKNAYASAYSETKSNLSSAKGKINSTSDKALKGLTSAQKKKIVSYVKDGKEINISNKYSATLKKAIANYNAALEANRVAANESAKASAEYTKVLRENTNAKYENITAYYEQNRSLNDARLSKLDAKLSYRESMGYSAVSTHSTGQKAVYDEMIKYNQDILKQLRTERDFYNADTLKKQYDNGELSREDYYALLSRIQEIDEAIYTTTTAINEARDEIYNLNIKRLDIVIDSVSKAIEKFKNIISLKESRNEDVSESYYTSQNSGLIQQIETLNSKREAILEEMKYYAVNSNKYQELATELQSAESDIYSKLTELEENKNAIMELRFKPLSDSIGNLDEQIDDLEHLRDLLSDDELINDKGFFTESGLADISLIAKSIDNTKQKIADYRYALEALEENFKSGNLSQVEFTEQSREYIEAIQSSTKAIEDYKDALIDLYTQQLEIENDALQESITKRKEALQAKKDYYNYDKSLKESNKDIVNLKNQIAALEGVNNASAKAEVERLRAQLSEAESELDDAKYDHGVQLQLDGYDEMSESADKILEDLLEDLKTNAQLQEQVVSDMLNNIVNNYDIAYSKIKEIINSTAVNNSTANSLNTTGGNIASSSTTSPNDRSSSYGNISSSTITSGNANTSKIESTIFNSTLNQTNRKVAKITPSLSSVSMEAGKTKTVTCTVQPSDAANTSLSVSSSNTKVATATVSGTTITITGKTAGSCTIIVTAKDGSGISASVTASVTAAPAKTTTTSTKTTTSSSASKSTTSTSKKTSSSSSSKKTTSTKKSTAGYISGISATISKSSSASNIKKVQTALKALGFKGKDGKALTIDGKWGTNTDYAVKNFQKSTKYGGKIKADGIIGKNTKAKFKKAGYFKGGIVDNVINNSEFLEMIRMNRDDGLITAKLGEGIIPKNMMPDFTKQLDQFNSIPADKLINSISNNNPNLNIHIDKFMDVQGNVDKNCVNDLRNLQNDITNNITRTLTQEFRKLGYK